MGRGSIVSQALINMAIYTPTHVQAQARSELEAEFGLATEEVEVRLICAGRRVADVHTFDHGRKQVPRLPAQSREEHEKMAALWPMTYHGCVMVWMVRQICLEGGHAPHFNTNTRIKRQRGGGDPERGGGADRVRATL